MAHLLGPIESRQYLPGRLEALHGYGEAGNAHARETPPHHRQHVAQGGAVAGTDHGDVAREPRQRPLALFRKQPFRRQPRLELLERRSKRSFAGRFDVVDDGLKVAACLEQRQAAAHHGLHAVIRPEAHQAVAVGEQHTAQLRSVVLEAEIPVAGGMPVEVRDLSLHPNEPKALFDEQSRFGVDLADRSNALGQAGNRCTARLHGRENIKAPVMVETDSVCITGMPNRETWVMRSASSRRTRRHGLMTGSALIECRCQRQADSRFGETSRRQDALKSACGRNCFQDSLSL